MPTVSISLAGNGNMPDGLACPTTPTIESVQSGPWNSPSTWDQNRLPNADDVVGIHPNHTLLAQAPFYQETWHNRIQIKGLCHHGVIRHGYQTWWYRRAGSRYRDGYGYLSLQASAFIYNYGQILGNAGYSGYYYGGQGGSVYLSTQGPFYNAPEATIRGGKGHRNQEYAGDGGHVEIYGHHTTNFGTLCAGNGSPTGQGGNLMITGNQGDPGILRNEGLLCGGEGQKGSFVSIQSRPLVMLNGGTLRTSKQGQIWIGADIILADDATQITGGQITLSGGDNAVLDLSRFAANAISASNLITVGNRGVIDFKASGNPALKAPEVKLHTDRVLLPDGKSLTDRIDTAHLIMGVAKTLRKVSLNTPAAFPIPLTIVNHGPKRETYQFSVTDTAGWVLGTLPSTLRLDGLQTRTLQFKVTLPATSAENTITINAFSQDDSEIRNTVTVRNRLKKTAVNMRKMTPHSMGTIRMRLGMRAILIVTKRLVMTLKVRLITRRQGISTSFLATSATNSRTNYPVSLFKSANKPRSPMNKVIGKSGLLQKAIIRPRPVKRDIVFKRKTSQWVISKMPLSLLNPLLC